METPATRLRVGVLGADGSAEPWIDALRAARNADLVVIADRDPERAAGLAARFRVPAAETDDRAVFVQHALDAAVVALSPAAAEKILPVAAERRVAVLLDRPPARHFDEATGRTRLFEQARVPLLVASTWRWNPATAICFEPAESLGDILQAHAQLVAPLPDPIGWRGDRVRAGGGVLITQAWDLLDAIVTAMGVPADVLAHVAYRRDTTTQVYDAEDTCSLLLRYADGRSATLGARWGPPQHDAGLYLGGADASLSLPVETRPTPAMRTAAIDALLAARTNPPQPGAARPPYTLRDHLPAIAVIECAYLSARTGVPESPHTLFERAGLPLPPRRRATTR